jgi:hypothetical protein
MIAAHMKKRAGDHSYKLYERLASLERRLDSEARRRDDDHKKFQSISIDSALHIRCS